MSTTIRRIVSFVLLAVAFSSVSACSPITAYDDDECIPGSNNLCDDL